MLEDELGIAGYIVGALDTAAFEQSAGLLWWPPLREKYQQRGHLSAQEASMLSHLETTPPDPPSILDQFPSHLHINQLPRTRGKGNGRKLITTLAKSLRAQGSPGVHLGVGTANERARAFYHRMGFTELEPSNDDTRWLGLAFD